LLEIEPFQSGTLRAKPDLLRQPVHSRLAACQDAGAEHLSHDHTFRLIGSEGIYDCLMNSVIPPACLLKLMTS
jgi:hypothetical protein